MTTIAITGIGGFIANRMIERAKERDWEVCGFDITDDGVERAINAGADAVVGDVGDKKFMTEFFDGVDVVFHTAAIVDESGDPAEFHRVNVEGTKNTVDAATAAGVDRFVHLSSVMVYGFDYPEGVDETHPLPEVDNIYCETKQRSDEIVQQAHEPGGLEVIVIRPGDVYGAGSRPWMLRPLEMMEAGLFNLPGGGEGVVNHVHVDNLIDAVFLALDQDMTGEIYNITDGVATSCREFFGHHARLLGNDGVATMPTFVLKSFLTVAGPAWRLFGADPPATPEAMDFLLRRAAISIDKARRELDYTPTLDLEAGMEQVAEQLRASGQLEDRAVAAKS